VPGAADYKAAIGRLEQPAAEALKATQLAPRVMALCAVHSLVASSDPAAGEHRILHRILRVLMQCCGFFKPACKLCRVVWRCHPSSTAVTWDALSVSPVRQGHGPTMLEP
jgi:hypothetical protein